jgi:hypothetical protein
MVDELGIYCLNYLCIYVGVVLAAWTCWTSWDIMVFLLLYELKTSSRVASSFLRSATKKPSFDSCIVFVSGKCTFKGVVNRQKPRAYTSRRLGFLPMNLLEQLLQLQLQRFVFTSLVEFTQEVSAGAEGIEGESQGCLTEILQMSQK